MREVRFEQPGSWDATLVDVGADLYDLLDYEADELKRAAHFIVTAAHIPVDAVEALLTDPWDTNLVPGTWDAGTFPLPDGTAMPLYMGVYTGNKTSSLTPGVLGISGFGLLWWLGDDNRGQLVDQRTSFDEEFDTLSGVDPHILFAWALEGRTTGTPVDTWAHSALKRRYFVRPGDSSPALFGNTAPGRMSRVTILEQVGNKWDLDFVVRMNGHVDMGPTESIFPEPLKVVTPGGANDPVFAGFPVVELAVDQDMNEYVSQILTVNGTDQSDSDDITTSAGTLTDIWGRPAVFTRYDERQDLPSGMLDSEAIREIQETNSHRTISVTTDAIADLLEPGQYVYVYDPSQGLTRANSGALDSDIIADSIMYRGRQITPIRLRCLARTDPNRRGEGFYFRYQNGDGFTTIDLTDHVQPETDTTKLEVDIYRRSLLPRTVRTIQDDLTIMVDNPTGEERRF